MIQYECVFPANGRPTWFSNSLHDKANSRQKVSDELLQDTQINLLQIEILHLKSQIKSMEYSQKVQNKIVLMGLFSKHQAINSSRWNCRQIIYICINAVYASAIIAFIVFEANNIDEYMGAIYSLTSIVGIEVSYISLIFKNDKILNMFELIKAEYTISTWPLKLAHFSSTLSIKNAPIFIRIKWEFNIASNIWQ